MYLQLLVCIAVAHLCCRCSAVPVMPPELHERSNRTQTSADPRGHDYVLNFFNLRQSFIAANCNVTFNGQKVSPHICNSNIVKAFTSGVESVVDESACSINFSIHLNNERAVGAELALYKLREMNTSKEAAYDVYIYQKLGNNFNSLSTVRNISSTESGWQVFNMDTAAAQWEGDRVVTLRVLIIRQDGATLPCSSVLSLFVIHATEKSIPHDEEMFVDTQPRPEEIASYVPVVTIFTSSASSLSPLCTLFPNRPDCQSRRLGRETPMLSLANSGSANARQTRDSCSNNHNFVLSIFFFRKELKLTNCTAPFNGQTVSALHCNREVKPKFFCAVEQTDTRKESFACDLQFNITVDEGETALGADMAMYKLHEDESNENIVYDVLIIHKKSDTFYSLVNIKSQLSSTASGWQVFSVDSIATGWQPGRTSLVVLIVYVTRFDGTDTKTLSCTEISSLFLLNELAGDSGSAQSLLYPLDDWEDYVPVLITFNSLTAAERRPPHSILPGLPFNRKRSIGRNRHSRSTSSLPVRLQPGSKLNDSEEENRDKTISSGCHVRDNEVRLRDVFPGATLIEPAVVNLGQCSTSCPLDTSIQELEKPQTVPEDSRAQSDARCKPTKQSDLEVLLRTGDNEPITIQILTNAITQECSCI